MDMASSAFSHSCSTAPVCTMSPVWTAIFPLKRTQLSTYPVVRHLEESRVRLGEKLRVRDPEDREGAVGKSTGRIGCCRFGRGRRGRRARGWRRCPGVGNRGGLLDVGAQKTNCRAAKRNRGRPGSQGASGPLYEAASGGLLASSVVRRCHRAVDGQRSGLLTERVIPKRDNCAR